MTKKIGTLLSALVFTLTASAQFYSVGSDPAKIRWKEIEGDNYSIIFPEETDSLARQYLYKMELTRPIVLEPLRINPRRMPVILHAHTTVSNGSVSMAPTRIDLFTNPDAYGVLPQPWIDHLVIHEMRHTGQDEHFTKGLYHPLSYIFGEQIYGAGLGLFISKHNLEGDAVMAETDLTPAGRGRQADFFQFTRTMFLNGDYRNYKKMKFGSDYKQTPNSYLHGYLMNTTARIESDDYYYIGKWYDATGRGLQEVKNLFLKSDKRPFDSWTDIYTRTTKLFTDFWRDDYYSRAPFSKSSIIPKKAEKYYCDYLGIIPVNDSLSKIDGSVITIKKGIQYSPELISIDQSGKEHHISYFSSYSSPLSKAVNGRIYWSESVYHNTASLEDYSVIRYYDYRSDRFGNLGYNTKYYNPAPNDNGNLIAVAEYPIEGSSYLVIISASGNIVSRIEAPEKGQIVETAFVGDDIYCSVILNSGMALYKWNSVEWAQIVPQQNQSIADIKAFGDKLLFTSDLDGLNNIYEFDTGNNCLSRITNSEYGAHYPYLIEDTLYFSEFDINGYHPAKIESDKWDMTIADFGKPADYPFIRELQEQRSMQSNISPDSSAFKYLDPDLTPSHKYSKLGHSIHVHSWAPVYYNVDNILSANFDQLYSVVAPGATLYSQNELGNIVTMFGYSYHDNRHAGHFKTTADIMNLTLELSADYNDRASYDYQRDTTLVSTEGYLNTKLRLYKSIRLTGGGWNRRFTPLLELRYDNDSYLDKRLVKMKIGASYSQSLPIALNQIFPRWGFGLTAYVSDGIGGLKTSPVNYTYAFTYLPGIIRNQGMKITATHQWHSKSERQLILPSIATMPRGYKTTKPGEKYSKVTVDYAIPVYAGDISLSVVYLKRFQFIPFADYAIDYDFRSNRNTYYSYGCDAMLEFHLLEFMPFFKAGVRYSRTPLLEAKNNYEMLFSVSL